MEYAGYCLFKAFVSLFVCIFGFLIFMIDSTPAHLVTKAIFIMFGVAGVLYIGKYLLLRKSVEKWQIKLENGDLVECLPNNLKFEIPVSKILSLDIVETESSCNWFVRSSDNPTAPHDLITPSKLRNQGERDELERTMVSNGIRVRKRYTNRYQDYLSEIKRESEDSKRQ